MMNPETTSDKTIPVVDNELDIRGLCCTLWRGKSWIIGIAVLFAVVALVVSYLVKQEWSAAAITDRPTVNALGGYYSQQQFLRNLDVRTLPAAATEQPGIADEAYNEFIMQLAAYDTRRDFWLQYVAFASHRAAQHLNEEIQGAWAARTTSMKAQVKRQEAVAEAVYKRELNTIQQALKIAETQGISRTQTDTPAEQLPDSDLFLLGKPMLQARLEGLQASGPTFDLDYDQNRAMLATLNVGPTLDEKFQTYRYLRTPEEPVKRDSPRRVFWLIMWGAMGALVGAGVALVRRPRK